MNVALKFSEDYDGERILKIGQYLTKLCVEHLEFTFLAHPVYSVITDGTPVNSLTVHCVSS